MEHKVIDAEVIEESGPGAAPVAAAPAQQAGDSVLARVVMGVFVLALGAGVYALKDPPHPSAIESAHATAHSLQGPVNGAALQKDYRARHISPYVEANTASRELTESMVRTEQKLDEFNQRLARQRVMNEEQFEHYKRRLQDEGYTMNDQQARDFLLKAGYLPPPAKEQAVRQKERSVEETASFAKSILGEFVAEEVESFLKRADMVTRVGVFLVGGDDKK
jgi:hypothetical protein